MKSKFLDFLAFSCLSAIFFCFYSCKKEQPFNYKLSIIFTNRLSSNGEQYPVDIISLCKPVESPDHTLFFMPTPILIHRLSNNYKTELKILKANATNHKSHINQVDAFFLKGDGKSLRKEMLTENPRDYDGSTSLQSYISSLGSRDLVYYFSESPKNDSINGMALYSDIDSLKASILNALLSERSKNIIVVYNPVESKKNIAEPADSTTDEYQKIIALADIEYRKGNYVQAKKLYLKAKSLHNDEYSKSQIAIIIKLETPDKQNVARPKQKAVKDIDMLTLSYARYHGEVVRGLPCGDGTMTFLENHEISENDNRKAERGDKIVGYWVKGKISHGKWFSSDGTLKDKLYGGTNANCE